MNTSFERTVSKDEWMTPQYVGNALGHFDLDPCSPILRPWPTAAQHFTIEDDGLLKSWSGRVWLNPPYGTVAADWMRKMCQHGNGTSLTFARTETKMFFESVWGQAHAIKFLKGRICFYEFACKVCGQGQSKHTPEFEKKNHLYISAAPIVVEGGASGAPSVLAAFGEADADILYQSQLDGKFIPLILKISFNFGAFGMTWRNVVRELLRANGGKATLEQLYELARFHPKTKNNKHWEAKIRQEVREVATPVKRGVWEQTLILP